MKPLSVTQKYCLAHAAREKLVGEASHAALRLRLLVGHANLLDSLLLESLHDESDQETTVFKSTDESGYSGAHDIFHCAAGQVKDDEEVKFRDHRQSEALV